MSFNIWQPQVLVYSPSTRWLGVRFDSEQVARRKIAAYASYTTHITCAIASHCSEQS
jgi:hypothetical protein